MSISRREFAQLLAALAAADLPLSGALAGDGDGTELYDIPRFGTVSLLHMTDSHAQLLPTYYREASTNIGVGANRGRPPYLSGEQLLRAAGVRRGTRAAYALASLDFTTLARRFGRVGGYAHLATLLARLRASRPGALLLDGGDTWQGSATALWTRGGDMAEAQLQLGVDVMTGHWEFTYGMERVKELIDGPLKGRVEFVAQNIATQDFGDPVFPAYTLREVNGTVVAVIGQAFPYTPIANPRHFVADWRFGIEEAHLQASIEEARVKGAQLVVLLSHNGLDVDVQLASRLKGLDAILGGHTHDGLPKPIEVRSADGGLTTVTNAGSNGKFVGVLDFEMRAGRVAGRRYRLLPVFADLLPADAKMAALIERQRSPYQERLNEVLAVTDGLLYRRGKFNGTFDQLILEAMLAERDAQIAFSPGFRWGTSLLPGETITMEQLMDQTAITYPAVTLNEMSGEQIKTVLEDVCDNLFNADPYYRQGGDMVRVVGLSYSCAPSAAAGQRISDLQFGGRPLDANRKYRVAGWAAVGAEVQGEPIYELVARYLRNRHRVAPLKPNVPKILELAMA